MPPISPTKWINALTASFVFTFLFWFAFYVTLLPDAPLYSTLDMLSFRIALAVLTAVVAAGLILSVKSRTWLNVLAYAGLLVALLSVTHAYLWGYESQIQLTELEDISRAETVLLHKGPMSEPQLKPMTLVSAGEGRALLKTPDGKESTERAIATGSAPLIMFRTNKGDLIESRYIKVLPGERKFFLIGYIPYKFIIEESADDLFYIEIWRGKRLISQGEIGADRTVMTDEVVVSVGETRAWADIRLRERQGELLSIFGLLAFAFSLLLSIKRKVASDA